MKTTILISLAVVLTAAACDVPPTNSAGAPEKARAKPVITVYKSPTCGCCGKWVDHLRAASFDVEVIEERDLSPHKARLGVPAAMRSCHTAVVDGYVIEGHVPAEDIRRLLLERPAAAGLAVPGMPVGSPGMEMGDRRDPYTVWLFGTDGEPQSFARHGDLG